MAQLTQTEIDAMVAFVKKHPLLISAGEDELNPLSGPPQIEGDVEMKDVMLYETDKDVQASFITRNNVKVTIKTRNIAKAMELLSAFAKGDNILASELKQALTMIPITDETEKTLTFANAFLQPGLSYAPGDGEEHEATLVYLCRADAATGKPFVFA